MSAKERDELINLIVGIVREQGGRPDRAAVAVYVDRMLSGETGDPYLPKSADRITELIREGAVTITLAKPSPTLPGMDDPKATPAPFAITRIPRGLAGIAITAPTRGQLVMDYNREQTEEAKIAVAELLHITGTQQFIVDGLLSILNEAQSRPPDRKYSAGIEDDTVTHYHFGDIKIMDHSGMPDVAIELPRAVFMKRAGTSTPQQGKDVWRELCNGMHTKEAGQYRTHLIDFETGKARIKQVSARDGHFWLHARKSEIKYRDDARLKNLKGVRDTQAVDRITLMIDRGFIKTMMLFVRGEKMQGAGYIVIQKRLKQELGKILPPRDARNAYRLYLYLTLTQRTTRPYSVRELCRQFAPKYAERSKAAGIAQLRRQLDAICRMKANGQCAPIAAYRIHDDDIFVARQADAPPQSSNLPSA